MRPRISIIIPVLDDPERLGNCLRALASQTIDAGHFEVIVVDNGSRMSLDAVIPRDSNVHLVVETKKGPYAARNTGVAASRGEILAFTDADTVADPEWIESGVAGLESDSTIGLLAGRVDSFSRGSGPPNLFERHESLTYLQQEKSVAEEQFGATANVFTWRSIFEEVGGFDEGFIANGDRIFGNKIHQAGHKLVYRDDVRVAHEARRTLREFSARVARNFAGHYEVKRRRGYPSREWLTDLWWDLTSPFRVIPAILRNEALQCRRSRASFFLVEALRRYIGFFERIRLRFGGAPRW